jgi:hypothetical protein
MLTDYMLRENCIGVALQQSPYQNIQPIAETLTSLHDSIDLANL